MELLSGNNGILYIRKNIRENGKVNLHSVEKVGILLSQFLRKIWKNFRENETNAE